MQSRIQRCIQPIFTKRGITRTAAGCSKWLWIPAVFVLTSCMHTVTIRSDPPLVNVRETVLGDLGQTTSEPIILRDVRSGSRLDLYFSKDGYAPRTIVLNNIRGDHDVLALLRPLHTRIWIGSIPAGARVSFFDRHGSPLPVHNPSRLADNADFSNQTYYLPSDATHFSVSLTKPGYETLRRDIRVQPGRDNRYSFTLSPRQTRLSLTTDPEGAEVYERRLSLLGTTPMLDLDLSSERLHRIHPNPRTTATLILTIRKTGYKPVELMHAVDLFVDNPVVHVVLEPEDE